VNHILDLRHVSEDRPMDPAASIYCALLSFQIVVGMLSCHSLHAVTDNVLDVLPRKLKCQITSSSPR